MSPRLTTLTILTLVTTLCACDPQADPGYRGEQLGAVTGLVRNEMSGAPGAAQAVLVWGNTARSGDYWYGETVAVTGDFPARFTLPLYTPPPADVLNDFTAGGARADETRIGVAYIGVTPAGPVDEETVPLGIAEDHLLVYVETDVKAGTSSAQFLGGQLAAGYHLMAVDKLTDAELQAIEACREEAWATGGDPEECGSTFDQLYPAPQDLATEISIRLVDDPELLDVPEWT